MRELKNCPFCGDEVEIQPEGDYYEALCPSCGTSRTGGTYEETVTAWNTRTASPRFTSEEREAMSELIDGGIFQSNYLIRVGGGDYEKYKSKSLHESIATVRAMLTASEIADKGKG